MRGDLKSKLVYPLAAYEKYNGFLGLVSYNRNVDKMHLATKGSVEGKYVGILEKLLKQTISVEKYPEFVRTLRATPMTLAFEVVDTKADPHIIPYPNGTRGLVLLAIIDNTIDFSRKSYEETCEFASYYGFRSPKRVMIQDEQALKAFYEENAKEDVFDFERPHLEGYVIEGADGFMFKHKLPYYRYWKYIRGQVSKYGNTFDYETALAENTTLHAGEKELIAYFIKDTRKMHRREPRILYLLKNSAFRTYVKNLHIIPSISLHHM